MTTARVVLYVVLLYVYFALVFTRVYTLSNAASSVTLHAHMYIVVVVATIRLSNVVIILTSNRCLLTGRSGSTASNHPMRPGLH